MKTLATLSTTILLLLFLAAAPAYPQDEAKPDDKAAQQENKDKDKNQQPEKDKAAKPDTEKKSDVKNNGQNDQKDQKNDERNNNNEMRQSDENRRPEAAQPQEQRPAQGRGDEHQAQRGKRIPDDKFRASFGRQHHFHVQRTQVVNVSQPVVVYGGYSFQLAEPWPADWAFDDDVYIDYTDDGYYLFDVLHPGIRIAVFIAD